MPVSALKNCPSNRTHVGHNLGEKYPLVRPSQLPLRREFGEVAHRFSQHVAGGEKYNKGSFTRGSCQGILNGVRIFLTPFEIPVWNHFL